VLLCCAIHVQQPTVPLCLSSLSWAWCPGAAASVGPAVWRATAAAPVSSLPGSSISLCAQHWRPQLHTQWRQQCCCLQVPRHQLKVWCHIARLLACCALRSWCWFGVFMLLMGNYSSGSVSSMQLQLCHFLWLFDGCYCCQGGSVARQADNHTARRRAGTGH
jgi:hypothetical protein